MACPIQFIIGENASRCVWPPLIYRVVHSYSEFKELYDELCAEYPGASFPGEGCRESGCSTKCFCGTAVPSSWWKSLDPAFVQQRRQKLGEFLQKIMVRLFGRGSAWRDSFVRAGVVSPAWTVGEDSARFGHAGPVEMPASCSVPVRTRVRRTGAGAVLLN